MGMTQDFAQRRADVKSVLDGSVRLDAWGTAAPPPIEELSEEEALARAGPVVLTPEIATLRHRIFEYLADRPDGTRITELEKGFNLSPIQMARILRSLIDDNKVEKRGLLYFVMQQRQPLP